MLTHVLPRTLSGVLLVLVVGLGAVTAGEAGSGEPDATRKILDEEQDTEVRFIGLTRARLSYPLKLSGAVGVMRVRQPRSFDCSTVCDNHGYFAAIEPGISGIQASWGYAWLVGERKLNSTFLSDVYAGWGVRAAALRTWGKSAFDPPGQTFLGVEGDLTLTSANLSLGVFRGVDRDDEDREWIGMIGLGWGF